MNNSPAHIKTTLQNLEENINDLDDQLSLIISLIQKEESIQPFESTYCTNCDKSCGRTNAEIYNCIMDRIKQTGDETEQQQYTKDFLEKDLQHLIEIIESCKKDLETIKRIV